MKLYCHRGHRYENWGLRELYHFTEGQVTECPDHIGDEILKAHPTKVCDVTNDAEPEAHTCKLNPKQETPKEAPKEAPKEIDFSELLKDTYPTTEMGMSPANTMEQPERLSPKDLQPVRFDKRHKKPASLE